MFALEAGWISSLDNHQVSLKDLHNTFWVHENILLSSSNTRDKLILHNKWLERYSISYHICYTWDAKESIYHLLPTKFGAYLKIIKYYRNKEPHMQSQINIWLYEHNIVFLNLLIATFVFVINSGCFVRFSKRCSFKNSAAREPPWPATIQINREQYPSSILIKEETIKEFYNYIQMKKEKTASSKNHNSLLFAIC